MKFLQTRMKHGPEVSVEKNEIQSGCLRRSLGWDLGGLPNAKSQHLSYVTLSKRKRSKSQCPS